MKSRYRIRNHSIWIGCLAIVATLGIPGLGQSNMNQESTTPQKPIQKMEGDKSPGRKMAQGGKDIGTGAARGSMDLGKGVVGGVVNLATGHPIDAGISAGKGTVGFGKNIGVGAGKGTYKIGEGIGGEFKKLGRKSKRRDANTAYVR